MNFFNDIDGTLFDTTLDNLDDALNDSLSEGTAEVGYTSWNEITITYSDYPTHIRGFKVYTKKLRKDCDLNDYKDIDYILKELSVAVAGMQYNFNNKNYCDEYFSWYIEHKEITPEEAEETLDIFRKSLQQMKKTIADFIEHLGY